MNENGSVVSELLIGTFNGPYTFIVTNVLSESWKKKKGFCHDHRESSRLIFKGLGSVNPRSDFVPDEHDSEHHLTLSHPSPAKQRVSSSSLTLTVTVEKLYEARAPRIEKVQPFIESMGLLRPVSSLVVLCLESGLPRSKWLYFH